MTPCMVQAITQFQVRAKGKTVQSLLALENLMDDYEKILTDKFGHDLKVATLIRCFLPVSRQHLELNLGRSTTHEAVGEALTTYEQITSSWRTTKVLKQTQNFAVKDGPMEVVRAEVQRWWKNHGKGKEQKGKAKEKNCLGPWVVVKEMAQATREEKQKTQEKVLKRGRQGDDDL